MKIKNIIILAAVAGGAYYLYKKRKDSESSQEANEMQRGINGAQYLATR